MSTSANEPQATDFVIRDGFPALRMPKGSVSLWNIDGKESTPKHPFGTEHLEMTNLESLREDCRRVFTARTREDAEAYSQGVTYFLPSQMEPRCALERLVRAIYEHHTEHLEEGVIVHEQSGAEWWTLVLDGEAPDDDDEIDEVGWHFDADYGLEDQAPNLLLHPRVATVTYLTDGGAPTVVLDKRSPSPNDPKKMSLEGSIENVWVSHPSVGKHMSFDGRLLHGAPASLFPPRPNAVAEKPPTKKAKIVSDRITLLVNIWLNHCPLDAEPLEEEIVSELRTPWKEDTVTWSAGIVNPAKSHVPSVAGIPPEDEDFVVGNRLIHMTLGSSTEEFKKASFAADAVVVSLDKGVMCLTVGEEVESDDEGPVSTDVVDVQEEDR